MTTIRLFILFYVLPTTVLSQFINDPLDTAKFRGVKKEYMRRIDKWGLGLQVNWMKEFDRNGKILLQEIYVNNPDTPASLNKYYYDKSGRIERREYLNQTLDKKNYEVDIIRLYSYNDNRLTSIKEYENGRLEETVTYKDTLSGQIARFAYFDSQDSNKVTMSSIHFYDKNRRLTKSYMYGDKDTNFFYYDIQGRDSLSYHINIGKPHSIDKYFYKGHTKILKSTGLLFPENSYVKKYIYNDRGDIIKVKDNMGNKRNIAKFKYQKNGLKKKVYERNMYKIKQKIFVYYNYELY